MGDSRSVKFFGLKNKTIKNQKTYFLLFEIKN